MKRTAALIAIALTLALAVNSQRLAVIRPAAEGSVPDFASSLRSELSKRTRLIDDDLAASAFRSVGVAEPFNMTADEGRRIGSVIGSDRFLILLSSTQRRAAFGGRSYVEAYAATFTVDSRTGLLVKFHLATAEAETELEACRRLNAKAPDVASEIADVKFPLPAISEAFPEPPPENSAEAVGLKFPVPYRRIRPEYTMLAALYSVKATVDIEVDIDAEGRIAATRIVRWAGFGLDESVEKAVRSMNWRPAVRNGKSLPMRVLLRYNFRKVEKDEEA